MEGHFETSTHVGLVIIGQPNVAERRLDNPVVIPWALSFLAYGTDDGHDRHLERDPGVGVRGGCGLVGPLGSVVRHVGGAEGLVRLAQV